MAQNRVDAPWPVWPGLVRRSMFRDERGITSGGKIGGGFFGPLVRFVISDIGGLL